MSTRSMERVALVFPGAMGDFCLAVPALRTLRRRHQGATVVAAVRAANRPLVRAAGIAECDADLDAAEAAGLFGGTRLPSWVEGVEVVYGWLGAANAAVAERLGRRVTYAGFAVERGPGRMHAATAYARAVGARPTRRALQQAARLAPAPSERARTLIAGLRRPILALHAGAGAPSKRWDLEAFARLARGWEGAGGTVVELRGPVELDEGRPSVAATVADCWPLADVVALLSEVDGFVGNDSGPSHVAGAVGVPGVVVFGPTRARRWRPLGQRLVALQAGAWSERGIPAAALPATRVLARLAVVAMLTTHGPKTSVLA